MNSERIDHAGEAVEQVLGILWDQGNCTGLDGWIGPGRGSGEIDAEAIYARDRDVAKALGDLRAALGLDQS